MTCPIEVFVTEKQGWIHGNPVADSWSGAVMRKPLGIQKCDLATNGRTDLPTDMARCRVACPRPKKSKEENTAAYWWSD